MRYPKLRELREAIKALIKGPYTTEFPAKPHEPVEGFRGKPEFHEEDCIGCTACCQVCPPGALTFEDKKEGGKWVRVITLNLDLCMQCGQCQLNCPTTKGIVLSRVFDMATVGQRPPKDSIRKELVTCQVCAEEVVAPRDQIIWVARRLGPLVYSNPSLFLLYLEGTTVSSSRIESAPEKEDLQPRAERIRLVCPHCRREAALKS